MPNHLYDFICALASGRGKKSGRFLALPLLLVGLWASPPRAYAASGSPANPVLLGVDMAGSYHLSHNVAYWSHEPYYKAIKELGANFVCVHLFAEEKYGNQNTVKMRQKVQAMDVGMRAHGLKYTLSGEIANFIDKAEVTPGVNEYEPTPGIHRWDFRMDWLNPVLPPQKPAPPAFLGVNYDECDASLLEGNRYVGRTPAPSGAPYYKPYLARTYGLSVTAAYERLVQACKDVVAGPYQSRVKLFAEPNFPDLSHIFARGGWLLTPKILKENFSSVIMAANLGAALQYQDRTDLWVTVDLNNIHYGFPGHSLQATRSALLMSYWLGVGTICVENLDYVVEDPTRRHPEAPLTGGLLHWNNVNQYQITAHGKVVQDFFRNYVPKNPRQINWRNYRPRVAIVRLPDGDWGQPGSPCLDNLLGNTKMKTDTISHEWLHVWPILTHGAVRDGSNNQINMTIYPLSQNYDFFVPISNVAVFDHRVTGPVLDSVDCFIVCGHNLTSGTFAAIRARVAKGATCIIDRRLYNANAKGQALAGKWTLVDTFKEPIVAQKLKPFLGPANIARFRFKDQVVEFTKGARPDSVSVKVYDRAMATRILDAIQGKVPYPYKSEADLNGDGKIDTKDVELLLNKFNL